MAFVYIRAITCFENPRLLASLRPSHERDPAGCAPVAQWSSVLGNVLLCLVLTACSRCQCAPWHPHPVMCVVLGCQSSGQVLCLFPSLSMIGFVLLFSEEVGC